MNTSSWLIAAAIAVVVFGSWWWGAVGPESGRAEVVVPELSPIAAAGRETFEAHCARCHGAVGGGTDQGPPLIHKYYEPNHHADPAFVLAIRHGVPQHHWSFGDMPAVPEVGDRSLQQIIAFVREVQRANGIE